MEPPKLCVMKEYALALVRGMPVHYEGVDTKGRISLAQSTGVITEVVTIPSQLESKLSDPFRAARLRRKMYHQIRHPHLLYAIQHRMHSEEYHAPMGIIKAA